MTAPKNKSGTPARDFTDSGTGESFEQGKAHDFAAGAHANYLAAGLLEQPEPKATAKPSA